MTFKDIYKTIHATVPDCAAYQDEQGNAHLTMRTLTDTGDALIYPVVTINADELAKTDDLPMLVARKLYIEFLCFSMSSYETWGKEEMPDWRERGMDEVLFSFAAGETLDKINDVLNALIEEYGVDLEALDSQIP